jgi:type I restriction enzyme, S subunit
MSEFGTSDRGKGWSSRRLGDFGRVVGGGTPSRSRLSYWNGAIPWASVKDFDDESVFIDDTAEHISEEGLTSSAATLVPPSTPVICTRMAVGRCALTTQATAINQDLKAFLLTGEIDRQFFIRMLRHYGPVLDRVSIGSTVRGITLGDLLSLEVFYPTELPEQSRIAGALELMDTVIAKTEAIITKLKQVRTGLLHDLLTRGLDEDGELRDRIRHPEEFTKSELGTIPKKWQVKAFRDFRSSSRAYLKTGPFGSNLKQEHWVAEGVPVVTIGSLGEGKFIRSELLHVSPDTANLLSNYALLPGDIVFSRVADVGRSAVVTEAERGWIMSSNMMWISLDPNHVDPHYVQANIATNPAVRGQVRRLVNAAGRDVANSDVMNGLILPWPRFEEQRQIVKVFQRADDQIQSEQLELQKLRLLKIGLETDLLTARIRVPESFERAEVCP